MMDRSVSAIAPLALLLTLAVSTDRAFAAAADVVNLRFQGSFYGGEDCRAMAFLPGTGAEGSYANRLLCSSAGLGSSPSNDGAGGFSVPHTSSADLDAMAAWEGADPTSSDHTGAPDNNVLCPFTSADDVFGASLSYVGNPDGDYYHEIVVGIRRPSGNDEHWILSFDPGNGDFRTTACSKLSFTTMGLLDGFSDKLVEVGTNKFCTANANNQILCFALDGLSVNPSSEVLIDSSDLQSAPPFETTAGSLALAFSEGKLFVADQDRLYALTLNADLTVNTVTSTNLYYGCQDQVTHANASALEAGPDFDVDGTSDLLIGNAREGGDVGILCALTMNANGTIRQSKLLYDNGDYGIPANAINSHGGPVRYGSSIVYLRDNGDGTHRVLVGTPLADSNMAPFDTGGFMEFDVADATYGLPEVCGPQPSTTCFEGLQGSFQVLNKQALGKNSMKWDWKKGEAFGQEVLGDPVLSSAYAVCIYDLADGGTRIPGSYGIDPGAYWISKSPKGFRMKDKLGTGDGITQIKIRTGDEGKTSVQVVWKGPDFVIPRYFGGPEGYFTADPEVIVQLHNATNCWSSSFSPPFKSNEIEKFQGSFKP